MAKEPQQFTEDEKTIIKAGLSALISGAERQRVAALTKGNTQFADIHQGYKQKVRDLLDKL